MNPFYKLIENLYLRIPNNLVYFDQMTKLHNRYYYDRVVKVKYNGVECVVMFVDINDLKVINDTEGHVEGSKAISYIGSLLRNAKANDACRIGGDEFILIYTMDNFIQQNMSSAVRKADKKMYEMKKKFHESRNNA